MPTQEKTFHLGLSMAGTVSAGTYTAGCMIELDRWLRKWSAAKKNGIALKAIKTVGDISQGDNVTFTAAEVPDHKVLISALTGASGGGVSAALYICGLTLGNLETLMRDTWMNFDIRDMLDNDDLKASKVYSLLNVKPIEKVIKSLSESVWGTENLTRDIDYLDEVVEIYMTLASYEGIPFRVNRFTGASASKFSIFKTHMDYIRFGFYPRPQAPQNDGMNPYRYELKYRPGQALINDHNWGKLIEASPATGAFPIGFKPRSVKRYRKEYDGQLFYLNYASWRKPGSVSATKFDYKSISPAWPDGKPDDLLDMEYFDGGAFNREPHDLARASILRKLGLSEMPSDGIETNGAVLLIDPFPAEGDGHMPGEKVKGLPDLIGQIPLLIDSLMAQGRFRADWIEKTLDETYYSRYLISPVRYDEQDKEADLPLAGGLLGAFSGFIDESYRKHDYELGHYNTFRFLSEYFTMNKDNKNITYSQTNDTGLLKKYEAVGWYKPDSKTCQIIPRCEEPNLINSLQKPIWPTLSRDKWEEVIAMAEERGKQLADRGTKFNFLDSAKDWAIWKFAIAPRFNDRVNDIAKELRKYKLLR